MGPRREGNLVQLWAMAQLVWKCSSSEFPPLECARSCSSWNNVSIEALLQKFKGSEVAVITPRSHDPLEWFFSLKMRFIGFSPYHQILHYCFHISHYMIAACNVGHNCLCELLNWGNRYLINNSAAYLTKGSKLDY